MSNSSGYCRIGNLILVNICFTIKTSQDVQLAISGLPNPVTAVSALTNYANSILANITKDGDIIIYHAQTAASSITLYVDGCYLTV